jgi:DNA processing protein
LTEEDWGALGQAGFPGVFYQGNAEALVHPSVAIVGTRKSTTYGQAVARKFGAGLATSGVTVVSGGAYGIDAAAHEGALSQEGRTIAVLANGLDKLYPSEHRQLFFRMVEKGGLVTGFAFGSKLMPQKFLARNALIAALSKAVLVIEAPERSGALSTLYAAKAQGKPVFAVTGESGMANFAGSRRAIDEGLAQAVSEPDELLEALGIRREVQDSVETTALGARVLAVLTTSAQTLEQLVERLGVDTGELLSEITLLEIDGLAVRGPGGYSRMP